MTVGSPHRAGSPSNGGALVAEMPMARFNDLVGRGALARMGMVKQALGGAACDVLDGMRESSHGLADPVIPPHPRLPTVDVFRADTESEP